MLITTTTDQITPVDTTTNPRDNLARDNGMFFGLDSPQRKAVFLLAVTIFTLPYTIMLQRQYRAAMWAQSLHLQGIQRALALAPDNSDYWHLLGRFHLFIYQDPQESVRDFSS